MRSSMAVSSHDSKSGVTGSPIHSPKRSMRVYAPGAGESHETSGGSAVIGLAWRIHSVPSSPIAHSMSCGVPRALAMRRASLATCSAWRRSMACSGWRREVARSPRMTHSSPMASPDTSRSPRPRTAVTMQEPRSPLIGSAVRATPAAAGATMRWMITAMRPSPAGSYSATRAAPALARHRSVAAGRSSAETSSTDSYMPAKD